MSPIWRGCAVASAAVLLFAIGGCQQKPADTAPDAEAVAPVVEEAPPPPGEALPLPTPLADDMPPMEVPTTPQTTGTSPTDEPTSPTDNELVLAPGAPTGFGELPSDPTTDALSLTDPADPLAAGPSILPTPLPDADGTTAPGTTADAGARPPIAPVAATEDDPAPSMEQAASPYVRAAASAAVDWKPWSAAAFDEAVRLDRPVIVDIGANWCHWCNIMDARTYSDPAVAAYINENFIAVKVDADERPDLNDRYQTAHYLINRKGSGWPLTVFALPDGRPFESLGYIPLQSEGERLGMMDILRQVNSVFKDRRDEAVKQADLVEEKVASLIVDPATKKEPTAADVRALRDSIVKEHDKTNGGFGSTNEPKFTNGGAMLFLLQYFSDTGDRPTLEVVSQSLTSYVRSGLRDHIMGGYFRYTSDGQLRKPRYEKKLYVQAEMLNVYSYAYKATGRNLLKEAGTEVVRFVRSTLERPEGGFYASQDADLDPDDNGAYFTWTRDEVRVVLGDGKPSDIIIRYLSIGADNNKDALGRSVPHPTAMLANVGSALSLDYAAAERLLEEGKRKMAAARMGGSRVPRVNQTVIASWNGTMISAYLNAYRYLEDEEARTFALKSAQFILSNMISPENGVAHIYANGRPSLYGVLDSQVHVARALVDCFQVTGQKEYLETAESLMNFVEASFLDARTGLYRDRLERPDDTGLLRVTRSHIYDNPTPAPNAVAAEVWFDLFQATTKEEYLETAQRLVAAVNGQEGMEGTRAGTYGKAMAVVVNQPPKALVIGERSEESARELHEAALSTFRMGKLVEWLTPDEAAETDYKASEDGKGIAYVCNAQNCAPPTKNSEQLVSLIQSWGRGTGGGRTAAAGAGGTSAAPADTSDDGPSNRRTRFTN